MEALTSELDVQLKLLKFTEGKTKAIVELAKWSAAVEAQQETADEEITHLSERLVQMNYKTRMQAKESEEELAERDRQKQLCVWTYTTGDEVNIWEENRGDKTSEDHGTDLDSSREDS